MLKVIFVIIGTLIGAGFASGREIYLFFLQYGTRGKIGIILTGLITGIIIGVILITIILASFIIPIILIISGI